MPKQAKRLCRWVFCKNASYGPYCPDHIEAARKREQSQRTTPPNPFYKTIAWQNLREFILARDPICKACRKVASKEADHIIALSDGGEALDPDNCQGLCKSCHSKKTAKENGRFTKKTYPGRIR
ncbi:MAG: HNH endonuclease [Candidatus Melainabacteria bacterium]|nr:HNH endonuclease [Candidatus Melainabacteria bacterium]